MELEEMSVPQILEQARARGLLTRGMSRDEIVESIKSVDNTAILKVDSKGPDYCEALAARVTAIEEKLGMGVPTTPVDAMKALSWDDLKALAKQSNIQVHGKKRDEIEAELRRIEDGSQ